jgi:hypothetical protein
MPIAPVEEHCVPIVAGPVTFVVESRLLTNEILATEMPEFDLTAACDDFGATVHVCDRQGVEHLRFDCFEHEPHYHYLMQAEGGQPLCRIGEVADGDPAAWTLERLRQRLPAMVDLAGAHGLARAAETERVAIDQGPPPRWPGSCAGPTQTPPDDGTGPPPAELAGTAGQELAGTAASSSPKSSRRCFRAKTSCTVGRKTSSGRVS